MSHEERAARLGARCHLSSALFRGGPRNPFPRENRLAGDERRRCKYSDFRFSLLPPSPFSFETIGLYGICNRLPQRDCSGLSPDSMTPSWLVGGRVAGRAGARQDETRPGRADQRKCKALGGGCGLGRNHRISRACRLTPGPGGFSFPRMFREVLKSKLHRAMITDADVEYEGSIEIASDLDGRSGPVAGRKSAGGLHHHRRTAGNVCARRQTRDRQNPHQWRSGPPDQGR